MKKQKMILFFNPGSGNGTNPSSLLEQATHKLVDLGFKVNVVMEHSKKKLAKQARKAAKKGECLAVVMGRRRHD